MSFSRATRAFSRSLPPPLPPSFADSLSQLSRSPLSLSLTLSLSLSLTQALYYFSFVAGTGGLLHKRLQAPTRQTGTGGKEVAAPNPKPCGLQGRNGNCIPATPGHKRQCHVTTPSKSNLMLAVKHAKRVGNFSSCQVLQCFIHRRETFGLTFSRTLVNFHVPW